MAKVLSPCIDVCKFTNQGRCVGCDMTKKEKKTFKRLATPKKKRSFVVNLAARTAGSDIGRRWARAYRRKCEKGGRRCVLDGA
ncbi:MAG: DUF1289 domain-containing protein [Pseudomonadota bacterium]